MIPARFLLIPLILIATVAEARMYQWTEPDTGTTQFSGKPPAWYRSGQAGPRVFVFDKNRVVDDTAIDVSSSERDRLRRQAFMRAEEDRIAAQQKALAAEQLKATLKEEQQSQPDETPALLEEPDQSPLLVDEEPLSPENLSDSDVALEQMRALIQEWEAQQTLKALEKLELQDNGSAY